MAPPSQENSRATALLMAGLIGGMVASLLGLLAPTRFSTTDLEPGAVAVVNDRSIPRADFMVALAALGRGRKRALSDVDQGEVLRRLIEEELLVQRAEALGLARVDRAVRKSLTTAMLDAASLEAAGRVPSDGELEEFFRNHSDRFRAVGALRVDRLFFSSASQPDSSRVRAAQAVERLSSGADFDGVSTELADASVLQLPSEALTPSTLREYVGPAAVEALTSSPEGEVVGPLPSPGGLQVLIVRARVPGQVPTFDEVRDLVEEEWARETADRAVRDLLDSLWKSAEIVVGQDASFDEVVGR